MLLNDCTSRSFRQVLIQFTTAIIMAGFLAGCSDAPTSAPPPIDAAKAKQATEDEYKQAMDQVDADPNLPAEEKQRLKRELEQSMKMQSRAIDDIERIQRGGDPGAANPPQ
jgi:hypothetical protein